MPSSFAVSPAVAPSQKSVVPSSDIGVGPELPVSSQAGRQAHNSPSIAADPTEPAFVVLANRLDAPDYGCELHLSGNGGRSFIPADPVPDLPAGAEKCYAPEVAFAADGTLLYLFVGLHTAGNVPMGAYLTQSTDRGRSFSRPRRILGPNSFFVRMIVDKTEDGAGRLHLVWVQANSEPGLGSFPPPPNPLLAAHSDDGGRSFSKPVQINDRQRTRVVAPALTIAPDGTLHVSFIDLEDDARDYHGLEGPVWEGTWSIVASRSVDGGRTFTKNRVVSDGIVPDERVMLIFTMPAPALTAGASGDVFSAWTDARNGDADVLISRSGDGGRTWAAPIRANEDAVGNGRRQYLPQISTSPKGRLDAVFYDRAADPENVKNDVVFRFSRHGIHDLQPPIKLTSTPSDSRIGQAYAGPAAQGLVEFGGRLGLASLNTFSVVAWTDTRNAMRPAEQEIFSRRVEFEGAAESDPKQAPGALRDNNLPVTGAAALAVALLLVSVFRRRAGRRAASSTPAGD